MLVVNIYFYIALKVRWGLLLSLLWNRQESPWIVQGDIYCQLQSMHVAFNDLWTSAALPPGPPTYPSTFHCLYLSSCIFTCPGHLALCPVLGSILSWSRRLE